MLKREIILKPDNSDDDVRVEGWIIESHKRTLEHVFVGKYDRVLDEFLIDCPEYKSARFTRIGM